MVLNNIENCGKIETLDEVLKDIDTVSKEPFLSKRRAIARERAVEKGFIDEYHMEGWIYFNRLDSEQYSGYDVDILHMTSSGEGLD